MKRLIFFLICSLIFSYSFAQAQINPASNGTKHNHLNWFTYFGQYKLNQHWGIHADVQFRMDENVQYSKQNLLRAGLIRYLNPNLNFTTGYAYITTPSTLITRGGSLDYYATEHRIFEQLIYAHKPANLNMTHRFRLEQRFVKKLLIGPDDRFLYDYVYGNRFRYFNRTIFDLTKNPEKQNVFYIALQNEVFLNFASPNINSKFFDQNRFLVAFGIYHDKKTRLELGYMNQLVNPEDGPNVMNHIVHVSVLQTLDFSSKE